MEAKPVIFVAGIKVAPEIEEGVNQWYDQTQAPWMLESNQIKRAKRYKLIGGDGREYPKYVAIYEFENQQAFEAWHSGAGFAAARARRQAMWPDDVYKVMWNAAYELSNAPQK